MSLTANGLRSAVYITITTAPAAALRLAAAHHTAVRGHTRDHGKCPTDTCKLKIKSGLTETDHSPNPTVTAGHSGRLMHKPVLYLSGNLLARLCVLGAGWLPTWPTQPLPPVTHHDKHFVNDVEDTCTEEGR